MDRLPRIMVVIATVSLLARCATTTITATWKDQGYSGGPFKKTVVIGLFKNLSTRQAVEECMAAELSRHGTGAVSSLAFMSPDQRYNYKAMEKLFEKNGIDGILIIKLMGISKKQKYHPGSNYFEPNLYYDMYNQHYIMYSMQHEPGYLDEKDYVRIQASLYANNTDKLVWRADTISVEEYQTQDGLTNPKAEAPVLAKVLHRGLAKSGLAKR